MKSVRQRPGSNIIGVIMTGMGKDGADGMGYIKSIGGTTFAQEEKSCVIYGMPKAAIEMGHVDYVISPDGIRNKLISLCGK